MTRRGQVIAAAGAAAVLAIAGILAIMADGGGPGRVAVAPAAPARFAGSASCASCHAAQHAAWQKSQHAQAMQEATEGNVLGRFDDATFTEGNVTTRFFRRDGRFFVHTDDAYEEMADFEVKYTFGVYPLQQYLVPFPDGRLQALGIAWDARAEADGGQRWFHLYPGQGLKAGDPLHWTGIDQNWNYQCADCHATNLRKNFDAGANKFNTTWSELSVGCEACHGPASNHLTWASQEPALRTADAGKGLVIALDERRNITWSGPATGTAARSAPRTSSREIDSCARCHSRRGQFTDTLHAGDNWLDGFRPALLEPGLYHVDGQQRDEVYTWGSFLQSRMHAAGVTCADCHDPHNQKLRSPGNGLCAQCHAPATYDNPRHHHHEAQSKGAECVACHMPTTTYMIVDPRHDHSLRIPRPDRSVALGTPNACAGCHAQHDAQWAADAVRAWYPQTRPGFQVFAEALAAADRDEPAAIGALLKLIIDPGQPALVRASALERVGVLVRSAPFMPPDFLVAVSGAMADPEALVRAAAAEALAAADAAIRAERIAPLLTDRVRLVRMAAARTLVGEPEGRLLSGENAAFTAALDEWFAAQRFNADRPEAEAAIGLLQFERGELDEAVASLRQALALDPRSVQASVNLADVYRARGDETSAEAALREAIALNPGVAAAHHALGLTLIRQARATEALESFKKAHDLDEANSRFAYVYAVALHDTGDTTQALAILRQALVRHPSDRDLLSALANYEAR